MAGDRPTMTRRGFATMTGAAVLSVAFGGACHAGQLGVPKLSARPRRGVRTSVTESRRLGLSETRDGWLQVPARAAEGPVPLAVLLHGAGSTAAQLIGRLGPAADAAGIAVLAPESRGSTWDAIREGFGRDVAFIDRALSRVFDQLAVDDSRLVIGGFSDGATYALSLGLPNGSLFRRILAFSPGFVVGSQPDGKPKVFVSHGIADAVLPIDRCSRMIVPVLRQHGYDVTYREFSGGHEMPAAIVKEAFEQVRT